MKHTNRLRGKNIVFLCVKPGGIDSNYRTLKV